MGLLDGKSAIITGSARGIGRATAELFVSEGAKVLINDLDGDVAEEAARKIDGETAVFAGDLTKPGTPDDLVKAAIDAFGQVDAVVNNAGYTWDGVIHKMTDEQFQAMLDIHTIVPFRVIRALAPTWREAAKKEARGGRGGLPQDRQHHLDLGHDGERRTGELLVRQGGRHRPDQDRRQGVGSVQDQLQRRRLRLRRDPAHPGEGEGRDDAGRRREHGGGLARDPGADAPDGADDDPARAPRGALGRRGPVAFLCSEYSNFIHGQVINVTGGQFTGMYS